MSRSRLFHRRGVLARENRMGYVFVLPWVIGFCAFFLYPLIYSLVLAFSHVTNVQNFTTVFRGFENFQKALFEDVNFLPYLLQSVWGALIKVPIITVFSLFIAILLNQNLKLKGLYRALFLLPVVIGSGVVLDTLQGNSATLDISSTMQSATAAQQQTMVNLDSLEVSDQLASMLGSNLAAGVQVMLEQISEGLWMSGIQIIMFLGSLQGIPDTYYEAAMCDGATGWEKFWKITLPMITPSVLVVVIYTMITYFTSLNNEVMAYVVDTSFRNLEFDYGSAMGWIYYTVIGLMLSVVFAVFRRISFYAGDK